jgi:hypothetical protein
VDAGNIGAAQQGFTVALSADGQTAIWARIPTTAV